jgi:L-fuculose-phosphate aldolase
MIRIPPEVAEQMIQVCQRLDARRLVAGTEGNVSVRFSKDHILATPTGVNKGAVGRDDLVVCDLQGRQRQGRARLTTEIRIHLAVYQQRDDVCAVVHAHPPHATAHAVARQPLDERLMPEAYLAVGRVALTPYGTPSTNELEDNIRPAVAEHDSILLANHGALTVGRDLMAACHRMEALEQLAHITLLTRILGHATPLTAEEMSRLDTIRGVYGTVDPHEVCWNCGSAKRPPDSPPRQPFRKSSARPVQGRAEDSRDAVAAHDPDVHWPGNPPVWQRPPSDSERETAIRNLAVRALRELRGD